MQHKVTNTYVYNPNGNVVSEHARRHITNLLAATAKPRAKVQTDSSDDSVHENRRNHVEPAQPDKTHVKRLLGGIAAHSANEELRDMGKHEQAMRPGRQLWARPSFLEEPTRNTPGRTLPFAAYSKHNYNQHIENWITAVEYGEHTPTVEQQRMQ